jgi:hypothetical protein
MAAPHRSTSTAHWLRGGARAGLAAGLPVPLGIVAIKLVPALGMGYPLLLLPLVLAGPLAVRRLRLTDAAGAALLAGAISGTIAAASLALALALFGDWFWALTSAAGAPPNRERPQAWRRRHPGGAGGRGWRGRCAVRGGRRRPRHPARRA